MRAARRPAPWRRRSTALLVAIAVLGTSSCIFGARTGQRCRTTDFGNDGAWILQCRKGRWARLITTQQFGQIILAASAPAPTGPPLRILVGGDSTGTVMARALARYAAWRPGSIEVVDVSMTACPVTMVEGIRHYVGENAQAMSHCGLWGLRVPAAVQEFRPEVSLVFVSMMEQADQRMSPNDRWRSVLEPEWAALQRPYYHAFADALVATGGRVMWADVPIMRFGMRHLPWTSDDPARTAALNASYRQFVSERADTEMLPIAARLDRPFGAIDRTVRPDGIHLSDTAANAEVVHWLVPMLLERFR